MSSGFKTGWDYDDAPTDPTHGGKLTAEMAAERIAKLEAALAQKTRVGMWSYIEDMIAEAVKDEREACAQLVDRHASSTLSVRQIAAAIRAQGSK
jgi:hypothetical protein